MSSVSNSSFILGVIPARWASSRFPGKMLHLIAGKPLIQHVWERCQQCSKLDKVIVATDEQQVFDTVVAFGGEAVMTSVDHPTGTDRLAEAVSHYPQATQIINIQGDEPMIEPDLIDELAMVLINSAEISMATAANAFNDDSLLNDPNVVKCVLNKNDEALYFSRSPLPFQRNPSPALTLLRHKGIYAYQRQFLTEFVTWEPSPLELAESLEQLRALENGARIKVIITTDESGGIDTLEQAEALQKMLQS